MKKVAQILMLSMLMLGCKSSETIIPTVYSGVWVGNFVNGQFSVNVTINIKVVDGLEKMVSFIFDIGPRCS
jgi:hypothetical protein